jgi:repressor LexA
MRDGGILDGDYVLVRVQPQADDGSIVVALLDDGATVKRLRRRGAVVELRAENPAYPPIRVARADALRVLGRVVGVVRLPQFRG